MVGDTSAMGRRDARCSPFWLKAAIGIGYNVCRLKNFQKRKKEVWLADGMRYSVGRWDDSRRMHGGNCDGSVV